MCGTAEVKIEMAGITAIHEVYICEVLGQKMLIGVDFLKPHGCVIERSRGKQGQGECPDLQEELGRVSSGGGRLSGDSPTLHDEQCMQD